MAVGGLADRHVVAQQIRDLAGEPGLAPRSEELYELAKALGAPTPGADLEPWTQLDLLAAYARPESIHIPVAEPKRWLTGLEIALGVGVFLPLLATWVGLANASSAYEALTTADPKAAGRPFLQLWQTGFEGRLDGLSFGTTAMVAATMIFGLMAAVAVHGWKKTAGDRAEEVSRRQSDQLSSRLVIALTRAQLALNEHRLSSPTRFAAELTGAAKTLTRLGDRAAKANTQLATAAGAVGDAVQEAGRQLSTVGSAVQPLELAAGRIEDAVRHSGKELEAAVSGSGVMVRKALEDVREVNGEVRDTLGQAGERVEDSVTLLAAAQRSFTTGVEVAADVSAQVLGRLDGVASDSAAVVAAAEEAARGTVSAAGEAQVSVRESQEAVRASQVTVREMAAHTEALREAAERFAHLLETAVPVSGDGGAAGLGLTLDKPSDAARSTRPSAAL